MFKWKCRSSPLNDDRGYAGVYVIAGMAIFFLLGLFTVSAYAYKVQHMVTMLHDGMNTAVTTALGDHTVPDQDKGGIQIVDESDLKQEFMTNLQKQLQKWPTSSYTLQSFQVFGESDRGSSPPPGFSQSVPGTSVYITMNMNIFINPGFIPMSNTHWSIPIYVMVSSNSYESSTKAWNLARGT